MLNKLIVSSLLFLFSTCSVLAFGQQGHRIVAKICEMNLSDKAKKRISEILKRNNLKLAEIATWPDYIRSEKKWDFAKDWHHTRIDSGQTAEEIIKKNAQKEGIDDVMEAIAYMTKVLEGDAATLDNFKKLLKDKKVKPFKDSYEATALAFLIHCVGDVHQPMHVGKNNDFGGNAITVLFFGEKSNLHEVWDEDLIDKEQLSFTEYADFLNDTPKAEIKKLQDSTIADWANGSVVWREKIYNTLYDSTDKATGLPSFSYQYHHDFLPMINDCMRIGGIRAAGLLNKIFK